LLAPESEKSVMDKLERLGELFAGRHVGREVTLLCVRWYLRLELSPRELAEMMSERGLSLALTTIMRWVQHYTPEFKKALASLCPRRRPVVACRRHM
jgi:transposase-like protein